MRKRMHQRESGFTIVELMVGIAMALLTTYAIMSSYKAYEGQKRTTSSSSDALINSQFVVTQLEREMMSAGYPFQMGRGGIGCDFSGTWTAPGTAKIFPTVTSSSAIQTGLAVRRLMPVLIVDGGSGALSDGSTTAPMPDAIRVMYGNAPTALPIFGAKSGASTFLPTNNILGVNNGDMALLALSPAMGADTTCQIGQVTLVDNAAKQFTLASAGSVFNASAIIAGASALTDLGALTINSYFVQNNNLVQNSAILGNVFAGGVPLVSAPVVSNAAGAALMTNFGADVVNLQAQYGIDTTPDGKSAVNQWVEPTGTFAATAITAVQAQQIRAIRFAVVLRSALPENKKDSGGNCTATPLSTQPSSSFTVNWPDGSTSSIDLARGATASTWRCYRYQVVSDIVPLRNLLWSANSYET